MDATSHPADGQVTLRSCESLESAPCGFVKKKEVAAAEMPISLKSLGHIELRLQPFGIRQNGHGKTNYGQVAQQTEVKDLKEQVLPTEILLGIWECVLIDIKPLDIHPYDIAELSKRRLPTVLLHVNHASRELALRFYSLIEHRFPAPWKLWKGDENIFFDFEKDRIDFVDDRAPAKFYQEVSDVSVHRIKRIKLRLQSYESSEELVALSGLMLWMHNLRDLEINYNNQCLFTYMTLLSQFCAWTERHLGEFAELTLLGLLKQQKPALAASERCLVCFPTMLERTHRAQNDFPTLTITVQGSKQAQTAIIVNESKYNQNTKEMQLFLEGAKSTENGQKMFEMLVPHYIDPIDDAELNGLDVEV